MYQVLSIFLRIPDGPDLHRSPRQPYPAGQQQFLFQRVGGGGRLRGQADGPGCLPAAAAATTTTTTLNVKSASRYASLPATFHLRNWWDYSTVSEWIYLFILGVFDTGKDIVVV